jgi:DNA modification methylase
VRPDSERVVTEQEIVCGNSVEVLRQIQDRTFQCCVTSPPYWGLRDYGVDGQLGLEGTPEEYVAHMVEVFREVRRVLRDDGTLWLNLGDSYAANRTYQVPSTKGGPKHAPAQGFDGSSSHVPTGMKPKDLVGIPWMVAFALRVDGWYLRSDIIWHKPNPMPEAVKDRPTKAHEYIFLMSKSEKYFYDEEAVREDAVCKRKPGRKITDTRETYGMGGGNSGLNGMMERYHNGDMPTQRNRRSVWTIPTIPFKGAHFAVFPTDLVEPCVKAGSSVGSIVLDPFSGSGTVGVVCKNLGRSFIGIDLNPEYCEMARKRIEDGK